MDPVRFGVWLLLWIAGVAVGKLPTLTFCILLQLMSSAQPRQSRQEIQTLTRLNERRYIQLLTTAIIKHSPSTVGNYKHNGPSGDPITGDPSTCFTLYWLKCKLLYMSEKCNYMQATCVDVLSSNLLLWRCESCSPHCDAHKRRYILPDLLVSFNLQIFTPQNPRMVSRSFVVSPLQQL